MTLTHRSLRLSDVASLDHELEALQHAVAAARQNSWHGGDVMQPEFESFLAALTKRPRFTYDETFGTAIDAGSELLVCPDPPSNAWREALGETG